MNQNLEKVSVEQDVFVYALIQLLLHMRRPIPACIEVAIYRILLRLYLYLLLPFNLFFVKQP